ncbi:MAG: radical SAM protein [Anaerolineae bacterium]
MTNLILNDVCNLRCPYCFALDYQGEQTSPEHFLSLEAFRSRLEFLERSGMEQVRLLGGEPTLHPQFVEMVNLVRAGGKKLMVFSNGLMPEKVFACLAGLSPSDCTVMINMVQASEVDPDRRVHQRQLAALRRLGQRALPGMTIYRGDFQAGFLLSAIAETGCRSHIRLGLAQPCLSGANQYLYPHEYQVVGQRIVELALAAAEVGVTLSFDCGFVRCMFSEADLDILRAVRVDFGWRCNPILDIDLAGRVIHCYPLSGFVRLPLTGEADASGLRGAFEAAAEPYRASGIYKACSRCEFKAAGECPGGCLATTMRRFRRSQFRVTVPSSLFVSIAFNGSGKGDHL